MKSFTDMLYSPKKAAEYLGDQGHNLQLGAVKQGSNQRKFAGRIYFTKLNN